MLQLHLHLYIPPVLFLRGVGKGVADLQGHFFLVHLLAVNGNAQLVRAGICAGRQRNGNVNFSIGGHGGCGSRGLFRGGFVLLGCLFRLVLAVLCSRTAVAGGFAVGSALPCRHGVALGVRLGLREQLVGQLAQIVDLGACRNTYAPQ